MTAAEHRPAHGGYPEPAYYVEFNVRRVPVLDTGIGQALGYVSDRDFIEQTTAEAERIKAEMTPEMRAAVEAAEAELVRGVIHGDGV